MIDQICELLIKNYWDPKFETKKKNASWHDPFKIVISCLLSTRTRDEMTDKVAKKLFSKYKNADELANASEADVEKLIYGVGFYHQKAKNIIKTAKMLKNGVPTEKKELMKLPGIGPKCAGVVRAYAFGIDDIPVDTHVNRISQRLGWTKKGTKPEETEKILKKKIAKKYWIPLNYCLVEHGKKICKPIKPRCSECFLRNLCEEGRK